MKGRRNYRDRLNGNFSAVKLLMDVEILKTHAATAATD
jgi:hypothetical protein